MQRRTFCLIAGAGIAFGQSKSRGIEDFFRDFTDEWVANDPMSATENHYFTGAAQDKLERRLAPPTAAESRKRVALARKGLRELRTLDRAAMTPTQALAAGVMDWQLDIAAAEEPYLDYWFPFEQMNGWNVGVLEHFTVGRSMATIRDAENYVAALEQVGPRTEQAISESKRLERKGTIPPRFILQATLKQMYGFIDGPAASNPFVTSLAQKMTGIFDISAARREELRSAAEKIVDTKIYPAWKKAIAALEGQLAKSTDDAGLWRLKGGREAYAYFLKRYTTTDLTAEEIHQIGLDRVAEIEEQMDELLKRLGRTEG